MDVYLIIELFLENHCGRTLSGGKETLDVMASTFWDFALTVACEVWLFSYICYATAWKYKQHHQRPWPWGTHFHLLWTPLHWIDILLPAPLHVFPTLFYYFFFLFLHLSLDGQQFPSTGMEYEWQVIDITNKTKGGAESWKKWHGKIPHLYFSFHF